MLISGHKLTVTYYGEITIEPFLNPEFDVDAALNAAFGFCSSYVALYGR